METPRLWQFSGQLSDKTTYEVKLCGQPSLRQIRQLVTVLKLYEGFLAEDEKAKAMFEAESVALGEADGTST